MDFSFDLISGLIDVETMDQLRASLDSEGFSHVILYGEPWDAGSPIVSSSQTSQRIKVMSRGHCQKALRFLAMI